MTNKIKESKPKPVSISPCADGFYIILDDGTIWRYSELQYEVEKRWQKIPQPFDHIK